MGFSKFKMAALRLLVLFVLLSFMTELIANAQKNVWRDDREAVLKADTSLVKIEEKYYQKVITVTYKEVNESSFDENVEQLREQREQVRSEFERQREYFSTQLEKLNMEIEAERNFVQATKKEMRWLEREEKSEIQVKSERREDFFKTKNKNEQ